MECLRNNNDEDQYSNELFTDKLSPTWKKYYLIILYLHDEDTCHVYFLSTCMMKTLAMYTSYLPTWWRHSPCTLLIYLHDEDTRHVHFLSTCMMKTLTMYTSYLPAWWRHSPCILLIYLHDEDTHHVYFLST